MQARLGIAWTNNERNRTFHYEGNLYILSPRLNRSWSLKALCEPARGMYQTSRKEMELSLNHEVTDFILKCHMQVPRTGVHLGWDFHGVPGHLSMTIYKLA